jgi:hypothetical protein
MCLNCGCGQPYERHGNEANITADDVRRAGEANGQDFATSAGNMRTALDTLDRGSQGEQRMTGEGAATGTATGSRRTG